MNVQDLVAKYKPSTSTAQPMKVSDLVAKYQNYQAPPTPAPAAPQSFASKMFGAAQNFSKGVAQSEINTVVGAGTAIDKAAGNIPGPVGKFFQGGTQTGQDITNSPSMQPTGLAQKIGNVVGTVAPYATGAGEAEGAALGAKTLAQTGSKAASWLAEHIPTLAANTAIGTAQTGNPVKGAEGAVAAEVGQGALKAAGSYIAKSGERALKGLTDALTPRVVGQTYNKAAKSGAFKVAEPSIFGKAGVEGDTNKSVQKAVAAVQNVASELGKKTKDIVKPGVAQISKNFNRVDATISEYANKLVKPFLQKSKVDYTLPDLRGALELVKPKNLSGEALKTYNDVREQILSAVASKVSPEIKGPTTISDLLNAKQTQKGGIAGKETGGDVDFWDGRKIIDTIGNEVTKGKIFGSEAHQGANAAWKDLRAAYKNYLSDAFRYPGQMEKVNRANEFLQNQGAGMNRQGWDITQFEHQFGLRPSAESAANKTQWDFFMGNLEGLYKARENLSTGLNTERGKNAIDIFTKEHPVATKTLEWAAGLGLGAVGAGELEKHL